MPYLNLDLNYFEHPKTKRLVGLLGRGAEVLPIKLWSYCGRLHAEDGRLTRYAVQEIETIVGWWGHSGRAVEALVTVGFLARDARGYFVHEWTEHQGHIVSFHKRGIAGAKARWANKLGPDASSNASSNAKTRPKHCPTRTNRTNKPPNPPAGGGGEFSDLVPPALDSPEFRSAWRDWCKHRRESRKKLTESTAKRQLARLEAMGQGRAVAVLGEAVEKGWWSFHDGPNGRQKAAPNGLWSEGRYLPG